MVARLPTDGKAGRGDSTLNGAFTFASREAYGLAYRSQREPPRTAPCGVLSSCAASSDRWRHWRSHPQTEMICWPTYDRKLEEVAAEEVVDAISWLSSINLIAVRALTPWCTRHRRRSEGNRNEARRVIRWKGLTSCLRF